MSRGRVQFQPRDNYYPKLDAIAEEIAKFLFSSKSQLHPYCQVMRISSSWRKKDYKNKLQTWVSKFRGRRRVLAPDSKRLIELVEKFFDLCEKDSDILKMRGLVPEKLLKKIFEQRYSGKDYNCGYGAIVCIDGKNILYKCECPYDNSSYDSDKSKSTIDIGICDGCAGEFVEIKLSPDAFHTRDIKYLRLLEKECLESNIIHTIYLVALGEDKSLIKYRLEELKLWVQNEFTLLGKEDVFVFLAS